MPSTKLLKIPTTCYLKQQQIMSLRIISKATGIPVAVLVRQGIDLVLKKRGLK